MEHVGEDLADRGYAFIDVPPDFEQLTAEYTPELQRFFALPLAQKDEFTAANSKWWSTETGFSVQGPLPWAGAAGGRDKLRNISYGALSPDGVDVDALVGDTMKQMLHIRQSHFSHAGWSASHGLPGQLKQVAAKLCDYFEHWSRDCLRSIALSLGCQGSDFDPLLMGCHTSLLSAFLYPKSSRLSYACPAHVDRGVLTFVPRACFPGLRVFDRSLRRFIDVGSLVGSGGVLVLPGYTLQQATAGRIEAGLHAVASTEEVRMSFTYKARSADECLIDRAFLKRRGLSLCVPNPRTISVKQLMDDFEVGRESVTLPGPTPQRWWVRDNIASVQSWLRASYNEGQEKYIVTHQPGSGLSLRGRSGPLYSSSTSRTEDIIQTPWNWWQEAWKKRDVAPCALGSLRLIEGEGCITVAILQGSSVFVYELASSTPLKALIDVHCDRVGLDDDIGFSCRERRPSWSMEDDVRRSSASAAQTLSEHGIVDGAFLQAKAPLRGD